MDLLYTRCAGLDVHPRSVSACARIVIEGHVSHEVRTFGTSTRELRDGYFWANEAPGWGIEVDERAAAKYPFGHGETGERQRLNGGWGEVRRLDGTLIKQ